MGGRGSATKKILITGCSGFIGINSVAYALKNGYQVVGLDLNTLKFKHKNLTFIKGDIRDRATVEKAVKGCKYVLHLAALASLPDFERDLFGNYMTNVFGFLNVLEAARKNGCKRFAYASSSAVYVNSPGFSEDTVIDVTKLRNHYGKSKLIDEMIADSYTDAHVMGVVGLRYFNIYGPGEEDKFRSSPVMQLLISKKSTDKVTIFGDGKQAKDFTHIDDAVSITFRLMEDATSIGVYNVGTGVSTSMNALARLLNPAKTVYVRNPYLSTYMFYLKADTRKLTRKLGRYKFIRLKDGVSQLLSAK